MKNYVFISPNYPESYWMFCRGLKEYGANVLAIVDTPYENLKKELKEYCTEIYVVNNFNNYDDMLKACGYFTFKYGKIDWIESNNEAWLSLDARLRDDFNVKTGFSSKQIHELQSKSAMKKYYEKANVPVAKYALVTSLKDCKDFVKKVGYPVIMKPDQGVGASFTYKIKSDEELENIYIQTKNHNMILEQFIDGNVFTLDGICDENGDIRYLNSLEYVGNCMDSVLYQQSIGVYTTFEISDEYRDIAQRTIHAFNIKNRFFHCEFFRLTHDIKGLGEKGRVFGLEVNFRPPGGIAPDLMNYAGEFDVYRLWAEVIMNQTATYSKLRRYSATFAGRRNSISYQYSTTQICELFKDELIDVVYLPDAYAQAMGNVAILTKFTNLKRREQFFKTAFEIKVKQ